MLDKTLQTLQELIPDDIFVGTSLILQQDGRFLYGLRPRRQEDGRQIIELTGIGGGIEEEDDSFTAGALREAQEEIGCDVTLTASPTTMVVRGLAQLEEVRLSDSERPRVIVFRKHRTPPHNPWHPQNQGEGCLLVFLAQLHGQPWPAMELPQLIWLRPEHILETAQRDVPLSMLLGRGAELVGADPQDSTETPFVRLTDSQEALALALGDRTTDFYRSLGTQHIA